MYSVASFMSQWRQQTERKYIHCPTLHTVLYSLSPLSSLPVIIAPLITVATCVECGVGKDGNERLLGVMENLHFNVIKV